MRWPVLVLTIAMLLPCLQASPASAHGPTPQKVEEKIVISKPAAAVWSVIANFAALCDWHPGAAKCATSGGNAAGAERTVTLKSGGDIVDGLDEYNAEQMFYGYRLSKENVEALPVSFYSATLSVKKLDEARSEVVWIARLYRADTGNFPAENRSDAAAVDAMRTFFREGLEALKAKVN